MTITNDSADLTEEQRARLEKLAARRSTAGAQQNARLAGGTARTPTGRPSRRHAAKGSRMAALALSLVTTGGLTALFHVGGTAASSTAAAPQVAVQAAGADIAITGDRISTRFGPVQVQASFAPDGRLSGVDAVLTPGGDGRSVRINEIAVPMLNQEALTVQNAQVDTVSGATYTSIAYQQSLQSAIDLANAQGATQIQ